MKFVGSFPLGLLNQFDAAAGFFNARIQPVIGFGNGLTSGFRPRRNKTPLVSETNSSAVQFEQQLFPKIISRIHRENVQGLNSDALLLLKRAGRADIWGTWLDCDGFVPLLAELESSRTQTIDSTDQPSSLKLDVFFSEKDVMIGASAGPRWFDECWRLEQRGNRIDYNKNFVEGTDHDSILHLEFGLAQRIFSQLPEHGK
jgi:hypothetical protein